MLNSSVETMDTETNPYTLMAEAASLTCFLNSLLREWFDWSYAELPRSLNSIAKNGICIPLGKETLWIPIRYYSELGRHEYIYPAFTLADGVTSPVDFMQLVDKLVKYLPAKGDKGEDAKRYFSLRVEDSLRALEELLEHRVKDFSAESATPKTFKDAEQYLIIGHSFHPSPKSRDGFSKADRFRYGPEYAGAFPLAWFAIEENLLGSVSSETFKDKDWVEELAKSDPRLSSLTDTFPGDNFRLYPMNPWQAHYLKQLPLVQKYKQEGRLIDLGEAGDTWYPTSSVRSIYRPGTPYMLKTSLNVRLTNSVRSLLKKEVDRGIQAHDVFESSHGQSFQQEYPRFSLIAEPAYLYWKGENGEAIEESIVICRENPFARDSSPQGIVLASLTQDNPYGGRSLIARYIDETAAKQNSDHRQSSIAWFGRYLDLVVEPLLMAQAKYGILLGAHQQNILVAIEDGLPSTAFFRDCQGTGYSEFAYELLKDEVKSLDPTNGNILPSAMTNVLFIYYLFINASFNVISTIARLGHVSESELIEIMRQKLLEALAENPEDPSCIHAALDNPKIMHKGNFLCSISDINENTSADPLAIYTAIANPFYQETTGVKTL